MDAYLASEVAYKNGYRQGLKDAVSHGKWLVETRTFKHNPSAIYVHVVCSECGESLAIDRFDITEWEEYKKHHYTVKHANYCSNCGAKMEAVDHDKQP